MLNKLLCSVFMVASLSAAAQQQLLATNMRPQAMHTIEDFLELIPTQDMPAADRTKLLQQGQVDFRDGVTNSGDSYYANYGFTGTGMIVMTGLNIMPNASEAEHAMGESIAGAQAGLTEHGVSFQEIPRTTKDRYSGRFFILRNRSGEPIGNFLIVNQGTHFYRVQQVGVGVFESSGDIEDFLSLKADAVLSFEPRFGGKSATAARDDRKRLQRETHLFGMMLLYTFIYFTARGGVGLVNRLMRPRSINGRAVGVFCVLGLAIPLAIYSYMAVVGNDPEAFARIDPFEQGQLMGSAIAAPLVPASFVLICVGIAAVFRNRKPADTDTFIRR